MCSSFFILASRILEIEHCLQSPEEHISKSSVVCVFSSATDAKVVLDSLEKGFSDVRQGRSLT